MAASLPRVASTLAAERPARVLQPGRRRAEREAGVSFEPLDLEALARDREVGAVVVVNAWKVARPRGAVRRWDARLSRAAQRGLGAALTECGARLLAVSRTQVDAPADFLRGRGAPVPPMEALYNPIADGLAPDPTARDPNLLPFASSPQKGLDQTLASFAALRRRMPELKLAIADPGHLAIGADPYLPGVIWLGSVPSRGCTP